MEREFIKGDRVRVVRNRALTNEYLQGDNRVGTVVADIDPKVLHYWHKIYWLKMDKPVKKEDNNPSLIPSSIRGYSYSAYYWELELLESAELQKPFDIWSVEPPKVKQEPQEKEKLPPVWEEK